MALTATATAGGVAEAPPDPRGGLRARSHCRFARPLIHFIPNSPTYSVPLFLKRQCDRTLGARRRDWARPHDGVHPPRQQQQPRVSAPAGCAAAAAHQGWGGDFCAVQPRPGRLYALRVLLRPSILYGAFVWARGAAGSGAGVHGNDIPSAGLVG